MGGNVVIAYAVEYKGIQGPYLEVREYPGEIGRSFYETHGAIFVGDGADPKEIETLMAAVIKNTGARYISGTARRACERKGIVIPDHLAVVYLSA